MTQANNIAVTLGWLAGSYKIADAVDVVGVKIAAAAGTDIRDSAISGKGLFATRSFSPGDVLITDFMQKQNTDDPRTRWEQSESCRYTNHADKPNAFIRKLGETVELVADDTIQPNEEITCNYRDASKTLGKAFFYTYRGKPYGNEPSEAAFMQKTAATRPDTFYGLPTFLKQSQTTDDILDRIANARSQTATEVSAGNAAAGNYRKGRFNYHGLRISIENPKGSTRSGTAADGTRWSTKMKFDYGYIRGTIGADGDPVDVFIGDDPKSEMVYVINQVNKSGSFDEHKVVLGALDAKQAKQTYLSNYKDGWTGCGSVVGMTMQQFKDWLHSGDIKKPAGEVKQASTQMDAAAKLRALLIEGNPDRPGEPERMHTSLTQLLQSLGYDVQRTPSVEYSDVPDADVAIGFSRGADRLRFSKAPVRIAVGSGGSLDGVPRVNHPRDRVNLSNPDEFNTLPANVQRAHSTLTRGMRKQLTDLIPAAANVTKPAESIKQAADLGIPELPQPKRTRVVMPYDDGYLLERMNNPKYPANLGRQRFPGGGIDVGETSQQAAAREMMEELGLSVKPEQLRSLGIHANADHGPEEYFELADHGIQPGNYTASIGGDKHIELIKGLLNSPHYWGAQLNTLQQPNPTTGMKQAANHTAITPCDNAVQALINMADTAAWRAVPKQVARLMKSAADIKQQVQKAMETLSVADPGYGYVYWHPKRNHLWAVLSDGDEQDAHDAWWKALSKIPGINKVITEAEFGPHGEHKDEWIQIKKARLFTKNSTINPFTLAGEPFGGPNAVTNSVVGALIGGGLGYGGGRLAEMLLPERHFERGRLSKNLALAGAVLGGTPGLVQGVTHMGMNHDAGDPSTYRSWLQPTNAQKVAPNSTAWRKHVLGKMAGAEPTPTQAAILRRSAKCAMATMSGLGNPGMRPINVDEFNNVIWHDPYSPPAVNAAAAGVVSGIQQHYGGATVLTPRHFIKGLVAAGVDAATATVAGGVLGVLGGLKPESQQTLQQMGLWSGLMRGSIGSIFGQ